MVRNWRLVWSFLGKALVLLAVCFFAVYFRTYSLHDGPFLGFRSSESIARAMVDRGIKEQVRESLARKLPQLSDADKVGLEDLQTKRLRENERTSYEEAVQIAALNFERARREKAAAEPYLLEADPYHYLYQTETLLETGRISDIHKAGKYLQPLMRAPHGHWEAMSLHPYVGLLTYWFLHSLDSKISLTKAVSYVPLILTLWVLLAYGVLGRVLKFRWGASLFGIVTLAFSPIFIQRSAFGWYDTDPYNYLFPIMILSFVFIGVREKKRFWPGVAVSAFLTGLYSLFWTGWPFILVLVPAGLLTAAFLLAVLARGRSFSFAREVFCFACVYLMFSSVFLVLFLTPEGFWDSIRMGWSVLNQFALAEFDVWPNVFLTVGEAGGITFKKLIFLTGNYVTFVFALLGVLLEGWRSFKEKNSFIRFRFLFFLIFSIPVLFMSLKTERFSLLFVLPLAVFVSFAVGRIVGFWEAAALNVKMPVLFKKAVFTKAAVFSLMSLVFFPLMLVSAHVVAGDIRPIMDDVWRDALRKVRVKTPHDSIVNSWWPPGYFITGVAHRSVTSDGGTQHFHETYWMAKALMSEDEREAAGILRMLNLSGDHAFDFLLKTGMNTPDAVGLIQKIVSQDRAEAFLEIPSSLTGEQKNRLLDMTHGGGRMPPSYVLVYNDLVEQNLALSVMAQWDFKKAAEIGQQKSRGFQGVLGSLEKNAAPSYIQDLLSVSGEFAKYTPASPLAKREGNLLFFKNGVRLDPFIKDALIFIPSKGVQGRPASVFYLEEGKLVEKELQGERLNISVLFFEEAGAFYSLIADARLIRSLLFRLYYLGGEGLSFFKPLLKEGLLQQGTFIRVFELDRERLFQGRAVNE